MKPGEGVKTVYASRKFECDPDHIPTFNYIQSVKFRSFDLLRAFISNTVSAF